MKKCAYTFYWTKNGRSHRKICNSNEVEVAPSRVSTLPLLIEASELSSSTSQSTLPHNGCRKTITQAALCCCSLVCSKPLLLTVLGFGSPSPLHSPGGLPFHHEQLGEPVITLSSIPPILTWHYMTATHNCPNWQLPIPPGQHLTLRRSTQLWTASPQPSNIWPQPNSNQPSDTKAQPYLSNLALERGPLAGARGVGIHCGLL